MPPKDNVAVSKSAKTADAVALLMADHKAVKALFKEFARLNKAEAGEDEKTSVVKMICDELTVHAQVEEEIFYPAAREAIDDDDLLDEAEVEHATAKDLIAQLREMSASDDLYVAKVTVLGEYIDHHVEEEEGEMFPKAKKAGIDTAELGMEMAARKEELKSEMGISDEPAPAIKAARPAKRPAKSAR